MIQTTCNQLVLKSAIIFWYHNMTQGGICPVQISCKPVNSKSYKTKLGKRHSTCLSLRLRNTSSTERSFHSLSLTSRSACQRVPTTGSMCTSCPNSVPSCSSKWLTAPLKHSLIASFSPKDVLLFTTKLHTSTSEEIVEVARRLDQSYRIMRKKFRDCDCIGRSILVDSKNEGNISAFKNRLPIGLQTALLKEICHK